MKRLPADDPRLARPGTFVMLVTPLRGGKPHYIGRDDADVSAAVRRLLANGCPACGARLHGAHVEPVATPADAWRDECRLWHRLCDDLCNPGHPQRPAGTDWACAQEGCAG